VSAPEHPDIDGAAVDIEPIQAPSVSVVRRERRSEITRPFDAAGVVDAMRAYQDLLPKLLSPSDYQEAGFENGAPRRFVKKSGWRKIATAFDLDVQLIRSTIDRADDGTPLRAEVWARAITPSGRSMDGDGYCSVDESRFAKPSARGKLENDLRATAATRAVNRAISGLVGMGEVSAEEVTDDQKNYGGPPHGAPIDDAQKLQIGPAFTKVLGDPDVAKAAYGAITQELGYMPAAVARAFVVAAAQVRQPEDVPFDVNEPPVVTVDPGPDQPDPDEAMADIKRQDDEHVAADDVAAVRAIAEELDRLGFGTAGAFKELMTTIVAAAPPAGMADPAKRFVYLMGLPLSAQNELTRRLMEARRGADPEPISA
jgi:hypothetical protein